MILLAPMRRALAITSKCPQTGTAPNFTGVNPLVPIDETVEPTFEDGVKRKHSRPGTLSLQMGGDLHS